jgi:hypothetical protein
MNPNDSAHEIRPFRCALIFTAVLVAHVSLGLYMYRGRANPHWVFADSDVVVIVLPAVLAGWGYYFALGLFRRFRRHSFARFMVACSASMVSFAVFMLCALNVFRE